MTDKGQKQIAIGLLSNSGDLKLKNKYSVVEIEKKKLLHWIKYFGNYYFH